VAVSCDKVADAVEAIIETCAADNNLQVSGWIEFLEGYTVDIGGSYGC
jgi:hypothetical protein